MGRVANPLKSMGANIQLAEGVISYQRVLKYRKTSDFKDSLYSVVLDHYELSLDELNENLDYYNSDPNNMELIYDKVLSKLSRLQSENSVAASKKDTLEKSESE